MKSVLLIIFLLSSAVAIAEETKQPEASKQPEEWNDTVLSDEVIHKIQDAQFTYKQCVMNAMRKPEFAKMESRHATDAVIRECEPTLSKMRTVYLDAQVPGVMADRHLKKLRTQVTRNVLQELMYAEAAKQAGR